MHLFNSSLVSLVLLVAACSTAPAPHRSGLTVQDLDASEARIVAAIKANRSVQADAPVPGENELTALELRLAHVQKEKDELEEALEATCVPYTDSLPDPKKSWTVAVSDKFGFSHYVTDQVVEQFIKNTVNNPSGPRSTNWDAREAVLGQFGNREYEAVRRDVLEIARNELKDPKRLWSVYARHKPALVMAINGAENRDDLKASLLATVPVFVNDPPPAVLHAQEAIKLEQARYDKLAVGDLCNPVISDRRNQAEDHLASIVGDDELYVVQWRLRRQDEGGKPLVAMWAKVLQDLAGSIDTTPRQGPELEGEASEG